ncbi:MAG: hypothetical protein PHP04_12025 [Bacteroidales bacterium]|nr:hypothetical protein [Bacteroidales bacterium]HNW75186.1 hypothetical protein [Bacteroidales bacterium]HPS51800.1 hypothetical protein [Bacteroidales bacterium]
MAKLFYYLFPIALTCSSATVSAQQPVIITPDTIIKTSPVSTAQTQDQTRSNKIRLDSIKKHRDSTRVFFFNNDFESIGSLNLHANDTAIAGFQNYDPLFKHDRFYATLGNIGQNYRSLSPFTSLIPVGFDYGIHSFDQYLYRNDSVKYYKVEKTYTELTYVQGAKKEQNFQAIFSRNIYRSLNLGFDFRVRSAPGAYSRQRTNHINFVLTTQYFTKNKRYGVIANFTVNRLRNYENGGIKYDSLFEQNQETNRQVIPVNLTTAQNRIKDLGFYMKHYFNLSRHRSGSRDTTTDDATRFDLGRITYSFNYNRQVQNYIDTPADSAFYPPPVIDTTGTYDSLTVTRYINEVIWSNPSFNPQKRLRILRLEAGIRQQYFEVSMTGQKHSFIQFVPHAAIDFNPFPSLRLEAKGDYVLGDHNEADLSLRVRLTTILGRANKNAGVIALSGYYSLQQPGWFYSHYHGNYYQWDTTWQKQGFITAGFSYSWKFIEAGFNISRINNYVYLDSLSAPRQCTNQFGHLFLYTNIRLNIGRFKITAQLAYQSVQGTTVLRVPAFMGNLSFYYSQPLFKGAATLQPGLNFLYNTSYYADAYNPSLRSYYLQDRREIGNYPYMDIFINLKIQRARFFVTYTHFNASFMSHDYYSTPDYPMQDGAFKFGIAWRFHD